MFIYPGLVEQILSITFNSFIYLGLVEILSIPCNLLIYLGLVEQILSIPFNLLIYLGLVEILSIPWGDP